MREKHEKKERYGFVVCVVKTHTHGGESGGKGEHQAGRNHGRYSSGTSPNEYFGFSRNGKVRIHFYLRTDGVISSYFPKKI